jgi:MFS transporter, DHA3 family, macrolide efflux protein
MQDKAQSGMRTFMIVAVGQVASLLGTGMTNFALTFWAFSETGRATDLALIGFFFITPMLLLSPTAGAMVDRYDRKLMMILSDLASGVMTVLILLLYTSGLLEIWHLYIAAAISGAFQSFQWPAFSAAISVMVPKEQYGRANGINSLGEAATGILAPLLAGALLGLAGLTWILLIDVITFVIAIGTLIVVHIPSPPRSEAGAEGQGSIWRESLYGFNYLLKRPSLLALQAVFMVGNFLAGVGITLLAPMILARTNNNELIFGSVQSVGAVGGLVGGILMSVWGGPKRLIHGVLMGWVLTSLFGQTLLGLGQGPVLWATGAFVLSLFVPIINGSNQAIWQAKVAPDVQGRVFSVRRLVAWFTAPLSRLVAGPLADELFEPAMMGGGVLVDTFGGLVGSGPGAGMSLILVITGLLAALVSLGAYLFPIVRDVEVLMPDHGAAAPAAGAAAEA